MTMPLDKAIEILTYEAKAGVYALEPDLKDALKLGIEALKRIMIVREMHTSFWAPNLPGETKE